MIFRVKRWRTFFVPLSLSHFNSRRALRAALCVFPVVGATSTGAVSLSGALSLTALSALTIAISSRPAAATPPVRGILMRSISAAPSGADGIRLSVYGDKSGAKVQVRLLSAAQSGKLSGFFASELMVVDFEGWKTVTLPLSSFKFNSDTNPGATEDGLSSASALGQSTKIQIVLLGASSKLFFNDLAWASGDNAAAPIGDFGATGAKEWQPVGDYDQLRSVRFGSTTVAPYAKDGKPSLQFIVRANLLDEAQINRPVVNKTLVAKPTMPYAVFARSPFDTVYTTSVPSATEIKTVPTLSVTACRDQKEPGTFAVYAAKAIKNATVTVLASPANAAGQKKPAGSVDIRVVRVGESPTAPELLMKDDRQSLTGGLPVVRLTGDATTDIPAETSKRFWITISVPYNQAPGVYKGKLRFASAGLTPTDIPLTVEVPNLELKTAFLQYGVELKNRIAEAGEAPAGNALSEAAFKAQLANIKDHGFKLIVLSNTQNLGASLKAYNDANLSRTGPVLIAADDAGKVSQTEAMGATLGLAPGFEMYYLASDNVKRGGIAAYDSAVKQRNRNQLTGAYIQTIAEYDALKSSLNDTIGEKMAAVYPISSEYGQKILKDRKRSTPNRDYWTWNIPTQTPVRNRLYTGYLLYQTGPSLYGALPGPYQDIPTGAEPYDELNPEDGTANMTTFPVSSGVLDTVQWEAVRAGVDDIRYIGAFKSATRDLKDAKKRKDLTDEADSYISALMSKDLLSLSPAQIQANRAALLRATLNLKAAAAGKTVKSIKQ